MASANLDLVRSLYAAWKRGDFSSTEWADPEIEYVVADGPAPGTWTGVAGMVEGFGSFLSTTEKLSIDSDEYHELDGERVLVVVRPSGRAKTSGVEFAKIRSLGAHLFHIRDGRVKRLVVYLERDRAFADLGLPSKADSTRS